MILVGNCEVVCCQARSLTPDMQHTDESSRKKPIRSEFQAQLRKLCWKLEVSDHVAFFARTVVTWWKPRAAQTVDQQWLRYKISCFILRVGFWVAKSGFSRIFSGRDCLAPGSQNSANQVGFGFLKLGLHTMVFVVEKKGVHVQVPDCQALVVRSFSIEVRQSKKNMHDKIQRRMTYILWFAWCCGVLCWLTCDVTSQVWAKPYSMSDEPGYQKEPGWPCLLVKSQTWMNGFGFYGTNNGKIRYESFFVFRRASNVTNFFTEILRLFFCMHALSKCGVPFTEPFLFAGNYC